HRHGRPIRTQPPSKTTGVITRSKIIIACLCVPLFAFEFVIVGGWAVVRVRSALAAEGVEVGVIANRAVRLRYDSRGAEKVFDVVEGVGGDGRRAGEWDHSDALATKENVFVLGVARGVGLGKDLAARTVPIELAARFLDAAAVAVIGVSDACGGLHLAFGVP